MSSTVHPQIRKQTPAEANAEYDLALEWLRSITGQTGRFQSYKTTLSRVFRRVLENRAQSLPEDISPPEFVETRFEANSLVSIWKQFRSDTSSLLKAKLKIVLCGANLTSFEGQKTEPRDILFELETGALFKSWGYRSSLASHQILGSTSKASQCYVNANASRHLRPSPKT
jgi:hypothetical protein